MAFTLLKPTGIDLSQTFAFTGTVTGAGGGKVLQVLNKTDGTYQSTSSSTFADTPLVQAITPASTSNKVLIMIEVKSVKTGGNTGFKLRLSRGASGATVLQQFQAIGGATQESTRNNIGSSSFFYLDSPSTTSSVSYVVSYANYSDGTGQARLNNTSPDTSSMVVMEISAWLFI